MRFTKGQGTGNDFVVLPDPDGELALDAALVAALCDRRRGLGADGVLRVVLSAAVPEVAGLAAEARWFMDYRNSDGSLAEMCGNGIRVYARYLVECGYAAAGPIAIATRAGVRHVDVSGGPDGDISVDMGPPTVQEQPRTVSYRGRRWQGTEVWMGNPHVVVDVGVELADVLSDPACEPPQADGPPGGARTSDGPAGATQPPTGDPLAALGRVLSAPTVQPHLDTNVEFVQVLRPGAVAMRVHERGSGETQSCGTGACAVAVAEASWRGDKHADTRVDVPGGRLHVTWADGVVTLTGPAELVAHGVLEESWLARRD